VIIISRKQRKIEFEKLKQNVLRRFHAEYEMSSAASEGYHQLTFAEFRGIVGIYSEAALKQASSIWIAVSSMYVKRRVQSQPMPEEEVDSMDVDSDRPRVDEEDELLHAEYEVPSDEFISDSKIDNIVGSGEKVCLGYEDTHTRALYCSGVDKIKFATKSIFKDYSTVAAVQKCENKCCFTYKTWTQAHPTWFENVKKWTRLNPQAVYVPFAKQTLSGRVREGGWKSFFCAGKTSNGIIYSYYSYCSYSYSSSYFHLLF